MIIELTEYESITQPRYIIPNYIIDKLRKEYDKQIKVSLEDNKNGDYWKFTAQGWVGYIPISSDFAIRINPKVPIKNLLGMLEYAYNLKSFCFLDDLVDCNTIEAFYNRIAERLASDILARCRQGIYQTYINKKNKLAYIRGRLDIKKSLQKPWDIKFNCRYQQHISDIEDNQILLWTLHYISRSESCTEKVRSLIIKAYHTLEKLVTLRPFAGKDCIRRTYNRLNQDYEQLHLLCRFFLDNCMPSYESGNYKIFPLQF
jgi:5-methylcytosine-specific restriction enzyme subunit McrC